MTYKGQLLRWWMSHLRFFWNTRMKNRNWQMYIFTECWWQFCISNRIASKIGLCCNYTQSRHICQPCQLSVAISRCRSLKGLRVSYYSSANLVKPNKAVQDFYLALITAEPKEDHTCCKTKPIPAQFTEPSAETVSEIEWKAIQPLEEDFINFPCDDDSSESFTEEELLKIA